MAADGKSKILVIGGTGYIGKFIVEASVKEGHPTYVLVRESTVSDPAKEKLLEGFKSTGVTIVKGGLLDHESLVSTIKQVDVVICTVGTLQVAEQSRIISAIKDAGGNVKRFIPSEFGSDPDRSNAVEPAGSAFAAKSQIRRETEKEGIPYTYVISNCFDGCYLTTFLQPGQSAPPPPKDKVIIWGDGNVKAVFNKEEDIATYTIKAVDDPRTLNKTLYIRPPPNTVSFNDLVSLWETKIGKTLEKIYVPEDKILKDIQESPLPAKLILSIDHSVLIKGEMTNFEIDPSTGGVEASELYPDFKYTTVDEYLNLFL